MPFPVVPPSKGVTIPTGTFTVSSDDVPDIYDIVIDGHGYMLARQVDPNIPFRTQRGKYGYSSTFVERTNIQGDFGDNQQSFWSTATQRDWSGGEGQHFFRSGDAQSANRFWRGENIDISNSGAVKLAGKATLATAAGAAGGAISGVFASYFATTTHLYTIDLSGAITDLGAHGATVADISQIFLCYDGKNVFISGGTQIRQYNGSVFSTFSATPAAPMTFVDNTLWGANGWTLSYYSTAGAASTAFTWKYADGTTATGGGNGILDLKPFGGQVIVLKTVQLSPGELWLADTGGANQVAAFPDGFKPGAMEIINGIAFIVGQSYKRNYGYRTEVWYYANGNIGRAYTSDVYGATAPRMAICAYANGFAFTDSSNQQIMGYDLGSGAVSVLISSAGLPSYGLTDILRLAPNNSGLTLTVDSTSVLYFPGSVAATTGKVITSQFDFESSLTKLLRGISVDYTPATDGDGGSVDVAYKLNATDTGPTDTAYTVLTAGAVSGSEYALELTCQSVSVQVTLNKGTSTNGPTLKRIYVRAVPVQQTFRNDEVIIDCTGADGKVPVQLRNETSSPFTGQEMADSLRDSITTTTPITITDRFGTIQAVIEAGSVEIVEVAPQEYFVRLTFREV